MGILTASLATNLFRAVSTTPIVTPTLPFPITITTSSIAFTPRAKFSELLCWAHFEIWSSTEGNQFDKMIEIVLVITVVATKSSFSAYTNKDFSLSVSLFQIRLSRPVDFAPLSPFPTLTSPLYTSPMYLDFFAVSLLRGVVRLPASGACNSQQVYCSRKMYIVRRPKNKHARKTVPMWQGISNAALQEENKAFKLVKTDRSVTQNTPVMRWFFFFSAPHDTCGHKTSHASFECLTKLTSTSYQDMLHRLPTSNNRCTFLRHSGLQARWTQRYDIPRKYQDSLVTDDSKNMSVWRRAKKHSDTQQKYVTALTVL